MHTVSRFDSNEFKDGDAGGNLFKVQTGGEVSNLHMLWDSGLLKYSTDFQQPLTDTDYGMIDEWASQIRKTNPEDSL